MATGLLEAVCEHSYSMFISKDKPSKFEVEVMFVLLTVDVIPHVNCFLSAGEFEIQG